MSVNKNKPHVLVLPEDEANRAIAIGFRIEVNRDRQFQILRPAGGWTNVLSDFTSYHAAQMDVFKERRLIVLIDFDSNESRLDRAKAVIPPHLTERVFVLGVLSETRGPQKSPAAVL
jgi:hypothetical protein